MGGRGGRGRFEFMPFKVIVLTFLVMLWLHMHWLADRLWLPWLRVICSVMIDGFSVGTVVTGPCGFRVKTGLEYSSHRHKMQNINLADTVIVLYHIMESIVVSNR